MMKRILSAVVLAGLIMSACVPAAMAVCYPRKCHFDIWQRCYIDVEDRCRGPVCKDNSGDGLCDGCSERLCYVDEDEDGQCDLKKSGCAGQNVSGNSHKGKHHKGGHGHH